MEEAPGIDTGFSFRNMIVDILSFGLLTSSLTITFYSSLLLLASHFHMTSQAINLTITIYVIFQATSPLFLASISDHLDPRPCIFSHFSSMMPRALV